MKDLHTAVRTRGFPKVGIAHRTVKLSSYRKMSVTTDEYKLILAHRKEEEDVLREAKEFLDARQDAIDVYNNYRP